MENNPLTPEENTDGLAFSREELDALVDENLDDTNDTTTTEPTPNEEPPSKNDSKTDSSNSTNRHSKKNSSMFERLKDWAIDKRYYFLAFILPVIVCYIAYYLFDAYPAKPDGEHSVLVLDLNGQYVYYFEYFRKAILGPDSIFYSWSRNLSGEFMGIIGYYLASPFTLITVLLPDKYMLISLFIMQLCKLGTEGVTMSFYLRHSKKLQPLHAVIFSTLWGACSYNIVQLMDPMWLDGLVYMPLIMYGVEKIVDEKKMIRYIVPLALLFVANFYIGFMMAIFCVIYFLFYFSFASEREYYKTSEKAITFVQFGISSIVAGMLAAFMILPVYYSLKLGKFDFTDPDYSLKLQFTAIDLMTRLLPSCYDTCRNEGLADIYCGCLCILLTPLYILNKKIKPNRKIGYTILLAVFFFSMYIKPIDMLWHGGQVPNWLPYRYSFMLSCILIVISAECFKHFDGVSGRDIAGVIAGFLIYILWAETREYENLDTLGSLWFAVALVFCFGLLFYGFKNSPKGKAIPLVLILIVTSELTINASQTIKDIDADVTYSTRESYEDKLVKTWLPVAKELQDYDTSLYRAEKTYVRTVNDNLLLGLKGVTHSSSTMNAKAIDFLSNLGYVERGHYTRYDGNTLLTDDLLGIKYILDTDGKVASEYTKIKEDAETSIATYQNENALPIGYMVNTNSQYADISSKNPFENQNTMLSTMLGYNVEAFKRIDVVADPIYNNVEAQDAGEQTKYVATGSGDHTVDFIIQAEQDAPIYFYFPAINEKKINVWYSTTYDNEAQEFTDFTFLNYYYETSYYCIQRLGNQNFEAGQYICVRCTIDNEYCYMSDQLFYQLDTNLLDESVAKLSAGGWNMTYNNGGFTKFTTEVTAQDNQVLFTSIPLEKGWTVKVDGHKVEPVELYNCLMGVPMDAGIHTVTFSFFPAGLGLGIVLFFVGAGCIALIVMYQKGRLKFGNSKK